MPPARVEAQRHRGFIFIADLFWVWWWFDFFSLLWVHLHLRSSSPICSGFGGGLIFFFLPWVHPHRRSVLGLVVVWFFFFLAVGSSSSPIFIADLFWVWWWSDFFFLAVGCGCHIEVVVGGVVVEVDVPGGKVYVMVVLGCRCGLCQ